MSLICPLCRGALAPVEKSYRCAQGHTFDLAKEGYLSLLHGRQKGEGRGDSKAMILARDRVHRAGVFAPLVAALVALPFETPPKSVLELGCGEGFFLGHMVRAHGITTSYGLDLSVDAVKLAAKTLKQSLILRADLLNPLPFADGSLDLIQSIFAPRPLERLGHGLRARLGRKVGVDGPVEVGIERGRDRPKGSLGQGSIVYGGRRGHGTPGC